MIYRVGALRVSTILTQNFTKDTALKILKFPPYYRVYFRQKKAQNSGLFVQPFLSLLKGEYEVYHNDFHYYYGNEFFGFAGGALIGFKWINQKRFSFEIHAGVGRYFKFDSDNDSYQEGTAYPRISFAIGKRF